MMATAAAKEEEDASASSSSSVVFGGGGSLELVSQGAEARIFACEVFGVSAIAKHRFEKRYRMKALDERLRKERTTAEVRCLARCRQLGIAAPALLMVDQYTIYMERVKGVTAKKYVEDRRGGHASAALMVRIGNAVARLHDAGMTHGDLTTSNFLCRQQRDKDDDKDDGDGQRDDDVVDEVVLIDFGLGGTRAQPEEKAVDLYVLERALIATHADAGRALLDAALAEYERVSSTAPAVLQRLDAVRARGRKRDCFG